MKKIYSETARIKGIVKNGDREISSRYPSEKIICTTLYAGKADDAKVYILRCTCYGPFSDSPTRDEWDILASATEAKAIRDAIARHDQILVFENRPLGSDRYGDSYGDFTWFPK